jgi:hypothetical protein
MVLGAIGLFLLIRRYGETLSAPEPVVPGRFIAGAGAGTEDVLLHLLIALTAVVIAGRLLGRLFTAISQPPVIGEVIGGMLLGPSLLGAIAPEAYLFILPPSVVPFLGIVAQLGVVLYMFLPAFFCVRGNAHGDRAALRVGALARVRSHHPRRHFGQGRRYAAGRPSVRPELA